MFGFSIKISFKKAAAALGVGITLAAALLLIGGKERQCVYGRDEQERLDYICSLGYLPSANGAETTMVTIPQEFSEVYENYNDLQLQAGFDLRPYKGCDVMRYTYNLNDFPAEEYAVVNVFVSEGIIIGGDISSRRLDGFMFPLQAKNDGQIG